MGGRADILNGAMKVGLVRGFCIDETASRQGGDSAVLLMGRCNTAVAESPAVVTLSVGPAGSGGAIADGNAALAAFFTSDTGRATLSRDGRARDVQIIQAFDEAGVFTMRVRDRAVGEYWRAVTSIKGRLVTLSVNGTPETPLKPEDGRALLAKAMASLRAANGAAPT